MDKNRIEVDIKVPNQTRYLSLIGKIGEDIAKELDRYNGDKGTLAYHLNMVLTEAMANAIKNGRVAVNGVLVSNFKQELDGTRYTLTMDGKPVNSRNDEPVYLLLNKSTGVLSTTRDDRGRPTVIDLVPPKYKNLHLHIIGRLDMDSSGLKM